MPLILPASQCWGYRYHWQWHGCDNTPAGSAAYPPRFSQTHNWLAQNGSAQNQQALHLCPLSRGWIPASPLKILLLCLNQLAFAIARRVAESPEATYNPLFYMAALLGWGTYLMHAIASGNSFSPATSQGYVSIGGKIYVPVYLGARYRDMMSFKEQFRSVDVLMIDDAIHLGQRFHARRVFPHI